MKYLAISILFLLLFSCALPTTKDLIASEITNEIVKNSYFSDIEKDYIYKAKIEVYKHNFGGILIIKKIDSAKHRVVFTTEFGNKLFDFLYKGDNFKVNYMVEEMDKKFILKTLQKDFKLLISEENIVVKQYQNSGFEIYKTNSDKRNNFYFFNKKTHTLDQIVNASKSKEKVVILFDEIKEQMANKIGINHQNIKLKIELEKFKKQ